MSERFFVAALSWLGLVGSSIAVIGLAVEIRDHPGGWRFALVAAMLPLLLTAIVCWKFMLAAVGGDRRW